MSLDALRWALKQDVDTPAERSVLVVYADHCRRGAGLAWPSRKRLEEVTRFDRKTITAAVKRLIDRGLIRDTGRRVGKTGRVAVYELSLRNESKSGRIATGEKPPHSKPLQRGEIGPLFPGNGSENGQLNKPENRPWNQEVLNQERTEPPVGANPAREFVFREGLALLTAAGKAEAGARSFLGKLCAAHGDARVADALRAAIAKKPVEPLSWIRTTLQGPARRKAADIDLHRVDYTVGLPGGDQ